MISFEDCAALCGIDPEEIAAIAEHEHVPEIAAAALASYLLQQPDGEQAIRAMIVDDIQAALAQHKTNHAAALFMALRHFASEHPHCLGAENPSSL